LARNYFQLKFSCHNSRNFFELSERDIFVLLGHYKYLNSCSNGRNFSNGSNVHSGLVVHFFK
jgi:hypothetical protein